MTAYSVFYRHKGFVAHPLQRGLHLLQEVFAADAKQAPGGDSYEVGALPDELGHSGGVGGVVAAHAAALAAGPDARV